MDDDVNDRLATEYRAARLRTSAIAAELDTDQAALLVPACPDWTVADLLAHVTGLASDLGTGRRPEGDTQAWVDAQVADRRGRSAVEIAAEWDHAAPAFEQMIAAKPHRWWGLVYDELVHEHDVRGAVGQPGERDGESVQVAVTLAMRLVEIDLTKHDLPAFRLVADGTERVVGEGEPALTLETTTFEALRLLGSRRTMDQLRAADFTGDLDRYLPGLVHMDLPTVDLGE
ncbi:MAG: maleylpyruvate isomerase family mycothiol-dependent enzyme [Ilumatobacteraceae bacterium]